LEQIVLTKISLSTCKEEATFPLSDAKCDNKTNCWGGANDVIFLSNTSEVYIIFQLKTTNKMRIALLDQKTLQIKQSWDTTQDKSRFGSFFIINRSIYGTSSYNKAPCKIHFKFNLVKGKEEPVDILFSNRGEYDTSLHYCNQKGQLWTVNNGIFFSYNCILL